MSRTIALIATAALVLAAPALAQDAAPKPTCGLAFTDAAGDTTSGAENLDLLAGFFTYEDDGSVRANLVLKNLSNAYPSGSNGVRWRIRFKVDGKGYYVGVFRDVVFEPLADPYYEYGTSEGSADTFEGIASGAFFDGPDGVIQVAVPRAIPIVDGSALTDIQAFTQSYTTLGVTEVPTDQDLSEAPGQPFVAAPCPSELPVALAGRVPRARSASKARKAVLHVHSSAPLSDLRATLRKGKKVVGTGRLKSLDGAGRLTVRLRRAVRKGTYRLVVKGHGTDGATRDVTLRVRFR